MLRRHVEKSLEKIESSPTPDFAVLVADIDGLHAINERHGGKVGDEVVRTVAHRIVGCVRKWDPVCRVDADEIAVHLKDLRPTFEPRKMARRVQEAVGDPIDLNGRRLRVSVSVSVVLGDSDFRCADEVLGGAEKALGLAKARGQGQVQLFDPTLHGRAMGRRELEAEIIRGLENEDLSLHYQPIVELSSGRIQAIEALLRWGMPGVGGGLPPEIISVAEESGLIVPLGEWALETACRQASELRKRQTREPVPHVSVNLSPRQLAHDEIFESIADILERTGYPGRGLHLEITETAVMQDLDRTVPILERIRELGVHLHLDDFGTGYSSLAYLPLLPVDTLKIDRSLISGMVESPKNLDITRVIVDLARTLGLTVVAEGVETREQEDLLQEMACDYAQGYRFHRPLPPRALEDVLGSEGAAGA